MTLLKKFILFGLKKHMVFSIIKLKTLVQLFRVSYLFLSGFWFCPSIIIHSKYFKSKTNIGQAKSYNMLKFRIFPILKLEFFCYAINYVISIF